MESYEVRAFAECRIESVDERRVEGYAIVFDSPSLDLGGFREIIDPSAVDRTLTEGADVRALVDHDASKIIGRTRAGTLTLRKDTRGLRVSIEPDPEISYAKDMMRSVKRGDITGMSFGFRALEDDWSYDGPVPMRTVLDMKLSEVSVVTFPAYPDTSVALRSLQAFTAAQKGSRLAWLTKVHKTRLAS